MISRETKSVAEEARIIYESRLREILEQSHFGRYVSIEPESGHHFLGDTFDEAVNLAIDAYPNRLTYTIRIGHVAAFHLGGLTR